MKQKQQELSGSWLRRVFWYLSRAVSQVFGDHKTDCCCSGTHHSLHKTGVAQVPTTAYIRHRCCSGTHHSLHKTGVAQVPTTAYTRHRCCSGTHHSLHKTQVLLRYPSQPTQDTGVAQVPTTAYTGYRRCSVGRASPTNLRDQWRSVGGGEEWAVSRRWRGMVAVARSGMWRVMVAVVRWRVMVAVAKSGRWRGVGSGEEWEVARSGGGGVGVGGEGGGEEWEVARSGGGGEREVARSGRWRGEGGGEEWEVARSGRWREVGGSYGGNKEGINGRCVLFVLLCVSVSLYVSVSLSVPVSLYVFMSLSVPVSLYVFMSLSVPVSLYVFMSLSVPVSLYVFMSLSVPVSLYVFLSLSVPVSLYVFLSLSVPVSLYVFMSLSVPVSLYVFLSLSVPVSLYVFLSLSVSLSLYVFMSLSVPVSLHVFLSLSLWAPVHIRDMKSLPHSIKDQFLNNSHTMKKFCAIPIEQTHEQENKVVKSSGGCIGLMDNSHAFKRWMSELHQKSVAESIRNLDNTGKRQYQEYVRNVLEDRSISIHERVQKNLLPLFKNAQPKRTSSQGKNIKELFGQLYSISLCRIELGILTIFSLIKLRQTSLSATKSQLLRSLEQSDQPEVPSSYNRKIMDGAVIVHSLATASVSRIEEYADTLLIAYLQNQLRNDSLLDTESPREREFAEGCQLRQKFRAIGWISFMLKKIINKFLTFLHKKLLISPSHHPRLSTSHQRDQKATPELLITSYMSCSMEGNLSKSEQWTLMSTPFLVDVFGELTTTQTLADIWVTFEMGNYRYLSINTICSSLGCQKSLSLSVFHALSGCDVTSAFKRKKESCRSRSNVLVEETIHVAHEAKQTFNVHIFAIASAVKLSRLNIRFKAIIPPEESLKWMFLFPRFQDNEKH
ncbi:hypothetical protein Hamer_G001423 [Homarus americanus]|uniref:Uncharacterized protein n=1 Tax=Homarus americanus TaxID=6706 RepID=A0A8J5N9Q5_HOMAM|nr:hypothetical protein Hamer_G001423 [Homarus americanus]